MVTFPTNILISLAFIIVTPWVLVIQLLGFSSSILIRIKFGIGFLDYSVTLIPFTLCQEEA